MKVILALCVLGAWVVIASANCKTRMADLHENVRNLARGETLHFLAKPECYENYSWLQEPKADFSYNGECIMDGDTTVTCAKRKVKRFFCNLCMTGEYVLSVAKYEEHGGLGHGNENSLFYWG